MSQRFPVPRRLLVSVLQILRTAHVRQESALAAAVRSPMLRRFPIPRRQLASVVVTRRCAAAHLESVHAAIVQRPRPSPLLAPTRRPANAEEMTRTVHVCWPHNSVSQELFIIIKALLRYA